MKLDGQLALVTGAAIRLGRALAEGLASRGMDVALHYHEHREEAEEVARAIRSSGRRAETFRADLSEPVQATALAREVETRFGPLQALVLSAAVYPMETLEGITAASMERTLRINVTSPFLLAREIGLRMKSRGQGSIVTLLDWAIDRPNPSYLPYKISKAGLRTATYGLARALAPQVRVNGIAPGAVLLPESTTEDERERTVRATPLETIGSAADVVKAALYLLEDAPFVTGSVLRVDGGRSLR